LTEDLKLPTGRRLLTVCLSMKDGERRGLPLLLLPEEDTGVMGMPLLLVVVEEEPVWVRVMSAASVGVGRGLPGRLDAGMSMERCGRSGRWSSDDDAGFFAVGDEVVVVSCKLKGVTRTRNE